MKIKTRLKTIKQLGWFIGLYGLSLLSMGIVMLVLHGIVWALKQW